MWLDSVYLAKVSRLPCLSLPSLNLKIICHHYVAPKKEAMGRNFQSAHLWLCNEPQPEDIQGHLQCKVNEKDYDWCAKKWKYNTVLERSKRLNCALQYTTGIQYHPWWGTYSVLMKTGKKWPKNLHHILVKDLIVSDYFYMWYFPKSTTWGSAIRQLSCGRQTHSLLLRLGFKSLFLK